MGVERAPVAKWVEPREGGEARQRDSEIPREEGSEGARGAGKVEKLVVTSLTFSSFGALAEEVKLETKPASVGALDKWVLRRSCEEVETTKKQLTHNGVERTGHDGGHLQRTDCDQPTNRHPPRVE